LTDQPLYTSARLQSLRHAGQLMVYMIHRQVNDAPCVDRTATAAVTFLPHSR